VVDADVPACGLTRLLGRDPVRSWPSTSQGRDFVTTGLVRSSRTGIAFATMTPLRNRQLWPPFLLDRLGELIASTGELFDLVLIDAGPVSQLAGELTACAALTPCAMVVSGGEASEEPLIQSAQRRLAELGAERILAARNFSARPLQNAG
jgi:Mrp family chromosome partitioning ATPase